VCQVPGTKIGRAPDSLVSGVVNGPPDLDTCYTCVVNTTSPRVVEFTSGSVALDLVDTVAARPDTPRDLLKSPSDLARWLKEAGLVRSLVSIDEHLLTDTRDLREAVFRAASQAIDGKPVTSFDRMLLNRWAAREPLAPQLTQTGAVSWRADELGPAAVATIARDAVVLLGGDLKGRLRRCERCSMIFVDRSRLGQRRWCSSAVGCGNKDRLARHRSGRAGKASL
jgi:predicted RNA-binding Zn ribbon-like protein